VSQQTWAGRLFKRGGSMAVTIKPAVAAALGMVPGDAVIMTIYGRHLVLRRVGRDDVMRLDTIPVAALPGARSADKEKGGQE
jgi:antitoxin component of MazEF toxin-antitoxin module